MPRVNYLISSDAPSRVPTTCARYSSAAARPPPPTVPRATSFGELRSFWSSGPTIVAHAQSRVSASRCACAAGRRGGPPAGKEAVGLRVTAKLKKGCGRAGGGCGELRLLGLRCELLLVALSLECATVAAEEQVSEKQRNSERIHQNCEATRQWCHRCGASGAMPGFECSALTHDAGIRQPASALGRVAVNREVTSHPRVRAIELALELHAIEGAEDLGAY